jgi:hypothetical protein
LEKIVLIGEESSLRRLPAQMGRKQTLYFDAIRYSIEMADLAHSRLRQTLYELSQREPKSKPLNFTPALLDAWSIVDSISRLRGLLLQTPGLKQNASGLQLFSNRTAVIDDLRNIVQHLNQQITKTVNQNLPVWGVLSWFTMTDPEFKSGKSSALIAGTMFESSGHLIVNPLGKTLSLPVDLITLSSGGYSVSLSDVMKYVEQLTRSIEQQLIEKCKDLPQATGDLLISYVIEFSDTQSNELTSEGAHNNSFNPTPR